MIQVLNTMDVASASACHDWFVYIASTGAGAGASQNHFSGVCLPGCQCWCWYRLNYNLDFGVWYSV